MARVREMVYEQWLHVVCREVVLHLARVREMQPYEQWLHVCDCREVVLHLARVREMGPLNNGCMLCVGRWCSSG